MSQEQTGASYLDLPWIEADVFISYAHRDNQPYLPDDERGWVDDLHYVLKRRLSEVLGEDVGIWWDEEKIRGKDEFADKLMDVLARVGVLVAVISRSYLKQPWCKRELREFRERAKDHGRTEDRIYPIIKEDITDDERRALLEELKGYLFLREKDGRKRPLTLKSKGETEEFLTKIEDLVEDMETFLRSFRSEEVKATEWSATVFLAETTPDLEPVRKQFRRELQKRGYRVIPDKDTPLPSRKGEFYHAVGSYLRKSDLSIHMIGADYGDRPEDERRCMARLQYELAEDREGATEVLEDSIEELKARVFEEILGNEQVSATGQRKIKHIIWMPPGLEPKNEKQKALVEMIRTGAALRGRGPDGTGEASEAAPPATVVAGSAAATGDEPQEESAGSGDSTEVGPASVYLIHDRSDLDAGAIESLKALRDALLELGLEVELPAFAKVDDGKMSESEIAEETGRVLKTNQEKRSRCDATLIYWGTGSDSWFDSHLDELRRLDGQRSDKKKVKAFYLGPGDNPRKGLVDPSGVLKITDTAGLNALVDRIRQDGEA